MSTDNIAPVLVEMRGTTLWITINRAERRNALNPQVIAGIHAAMVSASANPSLRAMVLTGAGEKAFCAGADLTEGTGVFAAAANEPTTDFGRLARVVRQIGIPIVARINGACVAGGMGLLSLCDLAIAANHARFGLPEVKVGVFPMQVLVYLRRTLAPRHLNYLCLTGELITAAQALQMGLVNEVVASADLDARVTALLETLGNASPAATRRGKYAMHAMESMGFDAALAFAESQIALATQTDDAREGLAAFKDKRAPNWVTPRDTAKESAS
jgi:enoyl-CoA hydratase/carnithine racemase